MSKYVGIHSKDATSKHLSRELVTLRALSERNMTLEHNVLGNELNLRGTDRVVHHCNDAEQFTCIAKILITRFSTTISQSLTDDAEVEPLCRILQLTSIVCSVRQGSRVTEFVPLHDIPYILLSPDGGPYFSIDEFLASPDRYPNPTTFVPNTSSL